MLNDNYLPGFGQIVDGWKRYHVTQAQITATKLFSSIPALEIGSIAVVGEVGGDYVHDFPRDRGEFSAFYSTDQNSATTVPATENSNSPLSTRNFASRFSSSATAAATIDMPAVLPKSIDFRPTISLRYDFCGNSPIGVNVFQEHTAAASVGATFNYLQRATLGIQYTNHFPVFSGGKAYGLIDRDFVSVAVSTEF